jgi:hypothetical protein
VFGPAQGPAFDCNQVRQEYAAARHRLRSIASYYENLRSDLACLRLRPLKSPSPAAVPADSDITRFNRGSVRQATSAPVLPLLADRSPLRVLSRSIACRCACPTASSTSAGIFRCAHIPGSHRTARKQMGTALCAAEDRAGWDGMGWEGDAAPPSPVVARPCKRTGVADCRGCCSSAAAKDCQLIPIPSTRSQRRKGASALSTPCVEARERKICARARPPLYLSLWTSAVWSGVAEIFVWLVDNKPEANSLQHTHRQRLKNFSCAIQSSRLP